MAHETLSPVSTLCLAILHHEDATGYEIKKESVEGDYRYFIDASFGSIYPALGRLAAEGHVTLREDTAPGRPARKIYSITEKGRCALMAALSEPPGPDIFRSRFLLVAKFAADLPQHVVRAAVEERKRELREEIAHLETIREEEGDSPAVQWITRYGAECLGSSLAYVEAEGEALIAIARADELRTAAE